MDVPEVDDVSQCRGKSRSPQRLAGSISECYVQNPPRLGVLWVGALCAPRSVATVDAV
jgi:hypothetical protein